MNRKNIRRWVKQGLSFALAFAMVLQSSMVGYASELQTPVVEVSEVEVAETSEAGAVSTETTECENETPVEEVSSELTEEASASVEETSGEEAESVEMSSEEGNVEEVESEEESAEEKYAGSQEVFADEESTDFVVNEDGELTAYNGTAEEVVIPEGVVTIGAMVFKGNETIKTVKLPKSLKTIKYAAFRECINLAEVEFNEGLETIEYWAFDRVAFGVNHLGTVMGNTITIPSTVKAIGEGAFRNSPYLEEVVFANGENAELQLGGNVFSYCQKIKTATLPNRLVNVPGGTFIGCPALESVEFGNNVEEIGENAFKDCTGLGMVTFPESLKIIKHSAFRGCTSLAEVELNEGLETIEYWAFEKAALGVNHLGTVTGYKLSIPSTVTLIGDGAFQYSPYLEEVVFENGNNMELTVGNGLFSGCENLKKATLPNRLKVLGENTFLRCTALENVEFGNGLTEIGVLAFGYCSSLKKAEMPESLVTIRNSAFRGGTNLAEVKLNEGLVTIGYWAFMDTRLGENNLGTVTGFKLVIPSTVQHIGERAFQYSEYLEEVVFENGETAVLELQNGAFSGCTYLKKVTLPNRLELVGENAFYGCTALETVEFGNRMTEIGAAAFYNCSSLKKAEMPASLVTIRNSAFRGCKSLAEVELNEGLVNIEYWAFMDAGLGANNLGEITGEKLVIPSTVQLIGERAFQNSAYLENVTFENGETAVLELWNGAFSGCVNLKNVVLPARLELVGENAFSGCTALETVAFGNRVTEIGAAAFYNCSSLKKAEMPASLITIRNSAFRGCKSLAEVELNEGLVNIEYWAFMDAGLGENNKGTVTGEKLVIPSTVQLIGERAFQSSAYLEEVVFENGQTSVLEIWGGAFDNCKNLSKVILPNRLQTLNGGVFSGATKLTAIYIPQNVTTIDDYAIRDYNKKKLVIYGEAGSAAEKYAKKLGVKFKNKSELGLEATGITLNRKSISLAGESAINRQIALRATIRPTTAQNKNVTFISNNENVATVDATGVVTIVGYGEADIIVTSLSNDNITTRCHVKVLRTWSEEELQAIRQSIVENNDFTVLTNVYKDLQEVAITAPDGIEAEWKLPYEIETGAKLYDIVLQKEGYQKTTLKAVEVNGITVTGLVLTNESKVEAGKSFDASVEFVTEGGELQREDYQISWKSSNSGNVSVSYENEEPLNATVTGLKKGKNANITIKVVLNRNGNAVSVATADKGKTWFEQSFKVTVCDYAVVDDITVDALLNQESVGLDALQQIVNLESETGYELVTNIYSNGELLTNVPLTWTSSNMTVATVEANGNSKANLLVKAKGTTIVSVAANKNGGFVKKFRVTVKDSTPRMVENSISLNAFLTDAAGYVRIMPSDGYAILPESLVVLNATGNASAFGIQYVDGNTYKIFVKDGENVSTGKQTVIILAKTMANEDTHHELPLTIQVTKQAPKVSIKQSAINLYEKDGRGEVQIVTDAAISSISYEPKADIGNVRLVQAQTDIHNGILTVKTENAMANNYTKASNKGTLRITFEGYTQEAAYEKAITLSVNKKLPVIAATPQSATLYPETLADTTEIILYNKTAGEDVLSANGYDVKVTTPKNYLYNDYEGEQFPEIQALKGAQKGKVSYSVTNDSWISGVKVNTNCTIKIGKVPTLSFGTNKLVLNTTYTIGEYDPVSIDAFVKGFEGVSFVSASIEGKDAKSKAALSSGALELSLEDGMIKGGIADSAYFAKAANLTYIVTAYTEDNMPVRGTLKVSVVLAAKKPAISFKTKGSINLLDRENTAVTCTPTVKNYTGQVKEVELYGTNATRFDATVENGQVVIRAMNGKVLKADNAYQLGMYVTLDSGVNFVTTVKVTPKQKNPKLVQDVKNIVLFESAKGVVYGEDISVKVADNQIGEVAKVQLVTENDTFGFEENGDGTGTVYVKSMASLKTGKKYTLKFAVTFEEAASNAKPVYVTVKVDYRK